MTRRLNSTRLPFTGAIRRDGELLVPHSMAFPSAMVSLQVLMGMPHDTRIINAHGRKWRGDFDYYAHLAISGEAFKFFFDAAEYFRFALPEGAEPLLDCFAYAGIPAGIFSNARVQGLAGGWGSDEALKSLVLNNLDAGYPVLLLGRTNADRVLLAIGYENSGDTLVAWTFVPGGDTTNKSFAPEDCQYIENWSPNTDAAALVKGMPVPPKDREELVRRALRRGEAFLRAQRSAPYGTEVNYYDHWIHGLSDEDKWAAGFEGFPLIYPEIWDFAERRSYLADFLKAAGGILQTDALKPGVTASNKIHSNMWKIHALVEGPDGKLSDPSVRREIASILGECRALDLKTANAIKKIGG